MKKKKSIFKTLAFWRVLVTAMCIFFIAIVSCGLIFHVKIFEEWDRTQVVSLDNYNGYNAIATYYVEGVEYKNQIGRTLQNQTGAEWLHAAVVGEIDLYVDYLVSDPNYLLPHTTRIEGIIVYSILWFAFVGVSSVVLVRIYSINDKRGKSNESKQEH